MDLADGMGSKQWAGILQGKCGRNALDWKKGGLGVQSNEEVRKAD